MGNFVHFVKHKKTLRFKIFIFLGLILGVIWLPDLLAVAVTLFLFVIIYVIPQKGIEIDVEKETYRKITKYCCWTFGKWKFLPKVKYISVFKTTFVTTVEGWRIMDVVTSRDTAIVINFIYGKNERLTVYKTYSVEDAMDKAEYFAKQMDLQIYDATTKKHKWLDK